MKLPSFAAIKALALDILFPPLCFACEKNLAPEEKGHNVCAACLASIALFDTLFCSVCGARLPGNAKFCHPAASYMLGSATSYRNEAVQKLIWRLKYEKLKTAAAPLAQLLARYLNSLDFRTCFRTPPSRVRSDFLASARREEEVVTPALHRQRATTRGEEIARTQRDTANSADSFVAPPRSIAVDTPSSSLRGLAGIGQYRDGRGSETSSGFVDFVVVPIPLHPERLEERGFNQAELLATAVAATLDVPLVADVLRRVKATPAQAKMRDRKERAANLLGAFAVAPNNETLRGKNIVLVDDVFTTGATIGEAVKTLKTAGAKIVIALTVARAI